ncbi:hypothetical protein B2J93_864 [Marssonina coronariae]|uniref:Mitochondrial pyruvate carrier n=1 Tax=Diplocarpon coronariae TaxID=2795749 RepID=A0A218ZF10_9HELO|nr:hypothetical protein JHW43_001990 [Diplocarpon mali]OWP05746.1 hypothetical protein B2J93_864 [Marssonina coronariae]
MPAPSSLFRAARPTLRSQFFTQRQAQSTIFRSARSRFQHAEGAGKRWQSTTAPGEAQSWFKRMWDSPIGLKTVHFWAPVMKWSIVLAGISDMYKPVEKLSLTQNLALTATGLIWTRWLATVNFFLGLVGVIQVTRIAAHSYGQGKTTSAQLEEAKESVVETAEGLKKEAVKAVKS